jgi:hypothetical protein
MCCRKLLTKGEILMSINRFTASSLYVNIEASPLDTGPESGVH